MREIGCRSTLAGRFRWTGLFVGLFVLLGLNNRPASELRGKSLFEAPVYGYRVIAAYPHDSQAFTQGLIYRDGFLYESTGLWGRSSVRKVLLETGEVLQSRALDEQYFGEGLVDWGARLLQLTWRDNVAFVYGIDSFEPEGTFSYEGEGWGITHDHQRLIMSDGTPTLRFRNPETFEELSSISVTDDGAPVWSLNELEFVGSDVYANVWQSDRVAIISPDSGVVVAWIDLSGLLTEEERAAADVLNGIAFDEAGGRLFVTGKLWPRLFHIEVVTGLGLPLRSTGVRPR